MGPIHIKKAPSRSDDYMALQFIAEIFIFTVLLIAHHKIFKDALKERERDNKRKRVRQTDRRADRQRNRMTKECFEKCVMLLAPHHEDFVLDFVLPCETAANTSL